jgi:predicted small lipoprotein YifL
MTFFKATLTALFALSLVFVLSGCGQKGPLTLPQNNEAPAEQEKPEA